MIVVALTSTIGLATLMMNMARKAAVSGQIAVTSSEVMGRVFGALETALIASMALGSYARPIRRRPDPRG